MTDAQVTKVRSVESDVLRSRRDFSADRLNAICDEISSKRILAGLPNLCIYVTGSYGRLEASNHSDLDVFFMHRGSFDSCAIPRISKTLLDADLIRIARHLGFPEFSNDGEYLGVHYIEDILMDLGGREDDFKNQFTARMLLLLESRPLHNESLYQEAIEAMIESYCRDYSGHEESFSPVFLINDVIRFWRTMCLNYEHRRNQNSDDERKVNKSHLSNLKLKFSRLLTCHSAIILISASPDGVSPQELLRIVRLSPLERLDEIAQYVTEEKDLVARIKECYSWFLEMTAREEGCALRWIGDAENRRHAFDKGRAFARGIYELLLAATAGRPEAMRVLVV